MPYLASLASPASRFHCISDRIDAVVVFVGKYIGYLISERIGLVPIVAQLINCVATARVHNNIE